LTRPNRSGDSSCRDADDFLFKASVSSQPPVRLGRITRRAVEAHVPVIVMLWNNFGYGEIRKYMNARGIVPVGGHRASMSARHGAHAEISIVARF